jgi:enhancing lycopene biosynthesis protein 2
MKVGVLLHGSGVYDGTEIHEAVLTLLAIEEAGHQYQCFAPNVPQHHVINHLNGDEMEEKRNVLIESARIARGEIRDLKKVKPADFDALVLPGGFGTAKNITQWAFEGPDGAINTEVQNFIIEAVQNKVPLCALCMSPTTVAKALQHSGYKAKLTVGSTADSSPYEIDSISQGIASTGAEPQMKTIEEVSVDKELKIVSAPCYMMEANILQVRNNIKQALDALWLLV